MKCLILTLTLLMSLTAHPQDTESEVGIAHKEKKEKTGYLYLQATAGVNHSMNENLRFGERHNNFRFASDISIGKEFTPFWSGNLQLAYNNNLSMNNWESETFLYDSFRSVELSVNGAYNLTNGVLGFKENRKGNLWLYAGVGVAYSDKFDDFLTIYENALTLGLRGGLTYVYSLSKRVSLVADAGLNCYSDNFNGIKSGVEFDAHLNLHAGIRFYLGSGNSRWERKPPVQFVEVEKLVLQRDTVRIVERVEIPAPKVDMATRVEKSEPVFFKINSIEIQDSEMPKIELVATYLKEHPDKVVFVLGLADKNTGNARINYYLGKNRATVVADVLKKKFGIPDSRVFPIVNEGDKLNPFVKNYENNRVAIMLVIDAHE